MLVLRHARGGGHPETLLRRILDSRWSLPSKVFIGGGNDGLKPNVLKLVLLLAFAAGLPTLLSAENRINNIVVNESAAGADFASALAVIESDRKLLYVSDETQDPPRLTLRFQEPVGFKGDLPRADGGLLLGGIRYEFWPGRSNALESIAFLLNRKSKASISQKDWILTLIFEQFPDEPHAAVADARAGSPDAPKTALAAGPGVDEFVRVALTNHAPLEIAQKELKLARRKLFEARRNFFPVLTGRGTETEGKTLTDIDDPSSISEFRRREYGLEIGQPVFQGGKIFYAERQAKSQREAAELGVEKVVRDVTFETVKALYTYLQAGESLALRRALLNDVRKMVETTRRKQEIGVASQTEYLGTLSGGNQAEYRALSQEKDMEIAKGRLLALLNLEVLPEDIPIPLDESVIKISAKKLSMEALVQTALARRLDLRIVALNAKAKEYGRKIARAEYLFKLDASGFVGRSGAAFKTEPLALKDSYNVGLKGVLYFGGSSVGPMYSREKTAPDLGSTSRTETEAQSINVGLLDSLGAGSNVLSARIEEDKAREDLRKARKEAVLEVKEAFFNYQRAVFQVDSAKKEVEYRKKESDIALAKDRLHQIEAPQLLQSVAGLTEAQIGLKEAYAFYAISMAALEKAVGADLTR